MSPSDGARTNCQNFSLQETRNEDSTYTENGPASELNPTDFSDRISYAFQLAMSQGPLCNEPVQGIAVFLEEVNILSPSSSSTERLSRDSLGRLTGEVIRTVRESIRQGFLDWSPRLFLAMYSCEIQASSKPDYTLAHFIFLLKSAADPSPTFPLQPKSSVASTP